MDWWTQNKDAITSIVAVFGVIGAVAGVIWAVIKWGFLRRWQRKLRVDLKVFEVITDPAILLPRLYATENDNSPLADHKIKYQPRDPSRDIQAELKAALNHSRYLLITAPTGYGKTREAGMLAQTMMLEGWRMLRVKTGWLDIPRALPDELNSNRSRVLIFLDDLNGLFSTGERTQSPRAEQMPMLTQTSYHDRLLQMLDMLEGMCTKKEIRVIATARSEADQWNLLNFNPRDRLWRRFERIELPGPTDAAIIDLLDDSTKQVDLKTNPDDFAVIARKSDGTYRNILLNLRRWRAKSKGVNKDDFTETLDGSWRDIYENAIKKHPAVKYIYEAIDLLQQVDIWSYRFIVEPAALMIWSGNRFQKLIRRTSIQLALNYLTQETKILRRTEGESGEFTPSDGQIEAKGTKVDWSKFILDLERLIFDLGKSHKFDTNQLISFLLANLAVKCFEAGRLEDAIRIWQKTPAESRYYWTNLFLAFFASNKDVEALSAIHEAIAKDPDNSTSYSLLGDVLRKLKRYTDAEEAYRQAIAKDINNAYAYFRLGSLLRILERYTEAENAYRQAITKNPHATYAGLVYVRLGMVLWKLERYAESEDFFRQAIDKDPNDNEAYFNFGLLLWRQERFEEAEAAFRKTIELDPSNTTAYKNLIRLLRFKMSNRVEETLPLLEKVIEINPENFDPYLAIASINKQLGKSKSIDYIDRARQLMPEDDWYNRTCLESISSNFDLAFKFLQRATQGENFDSGWAWEDPDLEWIRNDPRFIEIVGPKPENKNSEA